MNTFRKIHLWLSLPFGVIIAIVCFSGAMLVFEPEITRCIRKDIYYVQSTEGNPLPIGQLVRIIEKTLPDSVHVSGATVYADRKRTCQINLSKPRRASIYVDQYTGEITGKTERLRFFATMFKLHRWLLDSTNPHGGGVKVGKTLVGISTLMFVLALVSGMILWLPVARRSFRRSLSLSVSRGWSGFWRGLHVAGGMYTFLILLAMALTGLTWSFEWYRNGFYAMYGVEQTSRNEASDGRHGKSGRSSDRTLEDEYLSWQKVCDELYSLNPESPQITVGKGSVTVSLGAIGNGRASDRYKFDEYGIITSVDRYADSPSADKLRGWIYAVHTGALGGIFTRLLWFLSALLGASLPLTGYYIWLTRLFRKKKGR